MNSSVAELTPAYTDLVPSITASNEVLGITGTSYSSHLDTIHTPSVSVADSSHTMPLSVVNPSYSEPTRVGSPLVQSNRVRDVEYMSPHQPVVSVASPLSQAHRIGEIGCMSQASRSPLSAERLQQMSQQQTDISQQQTDISQQQTDISQTADEGIVDRLQQMPQQQMADEAHVSYEDRRMDVDTADNCVSTNHVSDMDTSVQSPIVSSVSAVPMTTESGTAGRLFIVIKSSSRRNRQ